MLGHTCFWKNQEGQQSPDNMINRPKLTLKVKSQEVMVWGGMCVPAGAAARTKSSGASFAGQAGKRLAQITLQHLGLFSDHERQT